MLANLTSLLKNVNVFFAERRVGMNSVVLVDELGKAQRTSHACGAAANDNDIGRHFGTLNMFKRFTKNQHRVCKTRNLKLETSLLPS